MSQTLYRTHKDSHNPYVILNKKFLDDTNLTLDMKGFLAYVMTKPNDWHFHINYLAKTLGCCEEKIYKIIRKLISLGYCYRYQEKNNNKFAKVITVFFESTSECDDFKKCLPHPVFTDAEVSDAEKPALLINYPILNKEKREKKEIKKSAPSKIEISPYPGISLTPDQHSKLVEKFSEPIVQKCYQFLAQWKEEQGDKIAHKSTDFGRINRWVYLAVKKQDLEEKEIDAREKRLNKMAPAVANETQARKLIENAIIPSGVKIEFSSSYLEIFVGNHPQPYSLSYDAHGFIDQFKGKLNLTNVRLRT